MMVPRQMDNHRVRWTVEKSVADFLPDDIDLGNIIRKNRVDQKRVCFLSLLGWYVMWNSLGSVTSTIRVPWVVSLSVDFLLISKPVSSRMLDRASSSSFCISKPADDMLENLQNENQCKVSSRPADDVILLFSADERTEWNYHIS